MPPNHQSGPQPSSQAQQTSSDQLDARMFKFMLEMDRRLDEKFKEARVQAKEDFDNMLKAEVLPTLREMNRRLEAGDKRFDDHSDRINNKRSKKGSSSESNPALTRRGGWISVDKLPAIIIAVGTVVATILSSIALMRSPGTQSTVATPPATTTAPGVSP